ncbi:MAG: ATP-binding cassette domain-containing protein, partial [Acetatifactor sp.]|nr:ATP-binding cassette domain-containing protein [Acetatifactor sp.]
QGVKERYERGNTYYFRTPSGSGKTTLFRLIAGVERPDETGEQTKILRHGSRISMVFQEDRLCEEYSALVNVDMVTGDRERSREQLCRLLEEEELHKPCGELSGGMKRRVAVARAMAAGGDVILLDEPFAGLDAESRRRTEQYIHSLGKDSAVLVATHTGEGEEGYGAES